jgi:RecA/RadA recombinase
MPAANIIELRQLLAERFPGLRTRAEELSTARHAFWPTGLPPLDARLRGGLPKSALTEVVGEERGAGSALLMTALIHRALSENKFVAVIDGQDALDVTQLGGDLSRLLWVRCRAADEALKAADLILRDGNLPLVLLDLVSNPAAQLRKIPATTWYRFQRLMEQASAVCVVLTPRAMVPPAQVRITLRGRFSLKALEREPRELLGELKLEVAEVRRFGESRELESRSA